MTVRLVLDFETLDAGTGAALAALRGYLAGMVAHQDLGTRIGPRDLTAAGFSGVRLASATVAPAAGEPGGDGGPAGC